MHEVNYKFLVHFFSHDYFLLEINNFECFLANEPFPVSKFSNLTPLTPNSKLLPQKVRILRKHKNWYFFHVFESIFFSSSYPWTTIIVQNFWRWETRKIVFVCFKRRLFVIFFRCKSKWYRRPKIAIFCQNHLVYLKNWWLEDENSNVKWQKPPILWKMCFLKVYLYPIILSTHV